MNKVLVIAGMHRSGTSLAAQWLQACGLSIGDQLLEADDANQDGYFEDLDFVNIHKEILQANKLPASGLVTNELTVLNTYLLEKYKMIIALKNKLHTEWSFKDPRSCLVLSYYKELLPGAKYLVLFRSYDAVVNSLVKRDFKQMERNHLKKCSRFKRSIWFLRSGKMRQYYYATYAQYYLRVWIYYNKLLLQHINLMPEDDVIITDHYQLLSGARLVFEQLTQHWNFDLQFASIEKIFKSGMMHQAASIDEYVNDRQLLAEANALQLKMQQLAAENKTSLISR